MKTSMMNNIISEIDKLPPDLQRRMLDFAKSLAPKGVEGKTLVRFEGAIPLADLKSISESIEEGCERVDISAW